MNLITKYILHRLIMSTVFLATVLVGGVWLTQSLRFIEVIVNHNVSLLGYFSLIGYLIPDLLAIILPICVLISVLFTYNRLTADHELVVLRSCGLSNIKIAFPAVLLAFGVMIIVWGINMYIVPASFRQFREMEHTFRNELSSAFIQEGSFNTARGLTVYIQNRANNGLLKGIFIHKHNTAKEKPYTIIAEEGAIVHGDDTVRLLLKNGTRQELDPETGKVSFLQFKQLSYDLRELVSSAQERMIKPYEKTLQELLYPEEDNLDALYRGRLRAEAHQRIVSPMFSLIYTLIALSLLLRGDFNRRGRQHRIVLTLIISIVLYAFLMTLIHSNAYLSLIIPLVYTLIGGIICFFAFSLEFSFLRWRSVKAR